MHPLRIPVDIAKNTSGDGYTLTFLGTGTNTDEALKATSVSINKLGEITATITKGDETFAGVHIGTVALVTFQNPEGLTKAGETYDKTTEADNSGRVDATVPGDDGVATLMSGYIEASNVDLAKEFAEMIMTQRGFQANSKMITVSDEMLSELVNMKR